ncbi:MAG: B12-binding domain-containing radical SAM protein [Rhodospirillales bacterium]|jgi:radical SAM superfamily enzyme YgiQ (UPF0313 family)|nr:B12-binding domain-containing radical SAM protein [Rhodospirillales bacterium]MBT4006536.1 B12-binding domain-containing radical SAM protein [Rhodospirillales bacterium]MBT5113814.1 B12-binding domain-containing radical SAM protein [Rhodospirillales bacterium]MBT5672342.1 B12-binding domain-containing radical SAM protein [Rhodospirillales bacterium]MBT6185989.1 B12-binding domain-containing radical SAM protein [Rhodospirillales bacterium]
MKIAFVSIDAGIIAVGFRKMASLIRSVHPDTEISYIVPTNQMSVMSFLKGRCTSEIEDADMDRMAKHYAEFDIVASSSMTPYAELNKDLFARIKKINPNVFIIWGGIHPIVDSEDAIKHADAICIGEGEIAFSQFLTAYNAGEDFTQTKNFWFHKDDQIVRNGFLPLQTASDFESFPIPCYADNEIIFKNGRGFVPLDNDEYLKLNGIAFHTVWSIGCPFTCTYCSNSKFIDNDSDYRKIRHSSVDRIIAEIKNVLAIHPYITSITFHDDSFIGLPLDVVKEFSERWQKEINISFSVLGALPGLIRKEKVELLVKAGMYRIKMGIQSPSARILKFYKRPATVASTRKAIEIISDYTSSMIPPTYDLILDNPVENREDVLESLRFIYDMPRPFTLNIFSLRLMPNTELANQLKALDITHPTIEELSYTLVKPSFANILVYAIDIVRPPRKFFEFLLKYVKPYSEPQGEYPTALFLIRTLYMVKRGLNHLRFLDFSYFPGFMGAIGYWFAKAGILRFWHLHVLKFR